MKVGKAILSLSLVLAGCGGGDAGSSGPVVIGPTPTPTPIATPTPTGTCSLQSRQAWAFAQIKEWYLFPETLPTALDGAPYTTLGDYVDALTMTARAQGRDRYFTYATSIAQENAYYESGETAGYGFRLVLDPSGRLLVSETFEGSPADTAHFGRGAEILAIGTNAGNLRTVNNILATGGTQDLIDALGPDTPGVTRVMRIRYTGTETVATLTKTSFDVQPVSPVYGARVIDDGGRKVGYINLRTFILSAEPALRQAFADFRAQGIDQFIVDLRYNGGGLLSVSQLLGSLLGGNRAASDVVTRLTFRPEKASENESYFFEAEPEAVSPTRIAFIGFEGTASASEIVINAFVPYLHANAGLIGSNTYGKPVGQIAIDQSACDDRLRIIAFAAQNAAGQGGYYNGLAPFMEATCQANDDLNYPLGSPNEESVKRALDYLAGRSCTPISGASAMAHSGAGTASVAGPMLARQLLTPERATTPQRDVPGLF